MTEETVRDYRGSEYEQLEGEREPRILSIKKMMDSSTFSKMRKRIELRDEHYFSNKIKNG